MTKAIYCLVETYMRISLSYLKNCQILTYRKIKTDTNCNFIVNMELNSLCNNTAKYKVLFEDNKTAMWYSTYLCKVHLNYLKKLRE
jgi:hypothetical protein